MDKQKTQRIIGILVIIAFVIVLIPLFFSRTDVSTEMSNAKSVSVPVPEQSTTTTTDLAKNDANEGQTPDDSAILGSETPATNQPEPSPLPINNTGSNFQNTANPDTLPAKNADGLQTQSQNIPRSADANASLQNTNANTTLQDNDTPHTAPASTQLTGSQSSVSSPQTNSDTALKETTVNDSTVPIEDDTKSNLQSSGPSTLNKSKPSTLSQSTISTSHKKHKNIIADKNHHSTKVKPLNINSNELAKLNSTAWAVQMGNFKDKNNARRLADKLRVAGYKAFTKEIKSANGNINTRVYIGPEFQRDAALQLSNKVAQETKLQGIVVTIKPLEI